MLGILIKANIPLLWESSRAVYPAPHFFNGFINGIPPLENDSKVALAMHSDYMSVKCSARQPKYSNYQVNL
jgi:hypothetical protein